MKYIVFRREFNDGMAFNHIVVFPNALVHIEVAEAMLSSCLSGGVWKVDSAGFVSPMDNQCYGESSSLGVESKPERDSRLLLLNDYGVGIE